MKTIMLIIIGSSLIASSAEERKVVCERKDNAVLQKLG